MSINYWYLCHYGHVKSIQFSCNWVIVAFGKLFVSFQWLLLYQSASCKEQQSIGTTSPWPACLRRDRLNLPMNGRATVWKTVPDNFHLRQLKVCYNYACVTLTNLGKLLNSLLYQSWSKALVLLCCLRTVLSHICHYVAEDGSLSLFNISRETSGFFICTSKNRVGSGSCNFTLAVVPSECFNIINKPVHLFIMNQHETTT